VVSSPSLNTLTRQAGFNVLTGSLALGGNLLGLLVRDGKLVGVGGNGGRGQGNVVVGDELGHGGVDDLGEVLALRPTELLDRFEALGGDGGGNALGTGLSHDVQPFIDGEMAASVSVAA